jgi:hypothetical protein
MEGYMYFGKREGLRFELLYKHVVPKPRADCIAAIIENIM